jgi:hypothetical protein
MRVGSALIDRNPPLVRTMLDEGTEAEARRILDAISSADETGIHERTDFPTARWSEWTVAAISGGVAHRVSVILHEDSFARSGPVENDGPETRTILDVARRVLDAPIDSTSATEAANALDTTFEAALMRRMVDPDLAEPFDVVWSGVTQLGPATLTAQTTFLDRITANPSEGMPVGRIRIGVDLEDEFERRMPTLRISAEPNLVVVGRLDAMERLRIEREAAVRSGDRA